ncbi:NADP-dependent oxidoreductase [Embleya sp. NPDC059237]|uniref:NADP-dependent oxidoreductase n=1 Tax=Embleya sp. NPDC059237 TaxID=3346784 RepID=UPI0036A73B57
MKALVARSYGPLEDLAVEDVPKPTPGPGTILVRAEAVALNPADTVLITGAMRDALPVDHPFVPGIDISGVVEAVGENVTRFGVGDAIIAWNGVPSGALAEYVLVDDAPGTAPRPAGLDTVRGAALPTGSLTAGSLLDTANVLSGGTLLIVGASGGIGTYAIQLAKQAGITVLGTGRLEDEEFVRRLGADHFIDYTRMKVAEEAHRMVPGGVDVVIDLARAGPALAGSAAAARPGGLLVSPLGGPAAFDRDVAAAYVGITQPPGRLDDFAAQAVDGRLRVEVATTYAFTDVRRAVVDFPTLHLRGKAVVIF